uniref:Ankyrin repeat-containing protein n=1 Tax=Tetraselmis sp. GSL018 TaxID=582737 RepID=A0A061RRR1_9CHLO|mmetsp:Transcript_37712/g.89573  ORF Transcript_37712/g.89573 Transcript_37712/m.89573 type:complete len:781 (+) Transcript_37712:190-2532(+)|eukprot:CAMPEP_0177614468 /NCGR_PEP_ID=MMETSP0419_2-20121207/22733_1 /TAXON_ID=582737 /ORGANISM="Tetraselmis sp., Strain GSL018" /LENGTH=780 /DNA_ID=CAMNT_0019111651 /DNA_START=242 /DNA_END=2584 /DNA_ORIENTATION=-
MVNQSESRRALLPSSFRPFCSAKPEPHLIAAARDGSKDQLFKVAGQPGIEVLETDQLGQSALHVAAARGDRDIASAVLSILRRQRTFQIDHQDQDGRTALIPAVEANSLPVVELLLQNKASVSLQDYGGKTAVARASESGHKEVLRKLLTHDASAVDKADRHGTTPLMLACSNGFEDCALLLLKAGASVHATNSAGSSALHMACKSCGLALVKKLHEAGADLQARDSRGMSPVFLAQDKEVRDFVEAELRRFAVYRQQFVVSLSQAPAEGRHGLTLPAVDLEKGCPVVLKFYRRRKRRDSALAAILQLDQDYVASVAAETAAELSRYVFKDASSYPRSPYCLVLFSGEETLEALLRRPTSPRPVLPLSQVRHIFRSVAESVEHIHLQGVVHGNLKPRNVMQFFDGHSRLINFENACQAGEVHAVHTTTLEACPPEVAKAWLRDVPLEASTARDVWAAGCILYQLLLGRKLVADIVEEAERKLSQGGASPPQVAPTELLGVLQSISLLTQEQVSQLVAPRRLLSLRLAHLNADQGSRQARDALLQSLAGGGRVRQISDPGKPPASGGKKFDLKRGARKQSSKGEEAPEDEKPDPMVESVLELSELLSMMLRVNENDRIGISEVLQSKGLAVATADEADVVGNIKAMKRKALSNQSQLMGKMSEVTMQLEKLVLTVSESGGSTRDDGSSIQGGNRKPDNVKMQGEGSVLDAELPRTRRSSKGSDKASPRKNKDLSKFAEFESKMKPSKSFSSLFGKKRSKSSLSNPGPTDSQSVSPVASRQL